MSFFSKQIDKRIAAYQRELIETHYREVENMYRQMRGWRHDFRNHIQLLAAYAQKGDLEAVKSYLAELEQDLARVEPTVKTGNGQLPKINRYRSPAVKPGFLDAFLDGNQVLGNTSSLSFWGRSDWVGKASLYINNCHGDGRANAVFLDGHASNFSIYDTDETLLKMFPTNLDNMFL